LSGATFDPNYFFRSPEFTLEDKITDTILTDNIQEIKFMLAHSIAFREMLAPPLQIWSLKELLMFRVPVQ